MHTQSLKGVASVAAVGLTFAAWGALTKAGAEALSSDNGKIPITTKSEEARREYLVGQGLSDRLLGPESLAHFDKALALDPEFASAELARANNSQNAKEFFEHQGRAVGLANKVSEGERLMILASEAGANTSVVKQMEYLDQAVRAYPKDERARFALGNCYLLGQQEVAQAIEEYKKALQLAPDFVPVFNLLGYAYRQQGDYAEAEQSFKKYIALIPNDPNPYDSYAELLLKMGRFDDSIAQYRKALSADSNFMPSHFGISADLMYQGKHDEAAAELEKMAQQARTDAELRIALFGLAVVATDSGQLNKALLEMDREYAVAEKKAEVANMAADLQAKGNIAVEMQRYDLARDFFDRSLQLIAKSSLSQEIKDNASLVHQYDLAVLALGRADYMTAKARSEDLRRGAEGTKNVVLTRQAHELAGRIALAEKDYEKAVAELQRANEQDPRNLYYLGQAYAGKGDSARAREFYAQAAGFNSLPQLNYAFIRLKAQAAKNKA